MKRHKENVNKYKVSVLLRNKNMRGENERDKVQKLYKMKTMQVFKRLSKKTKKGQTRIYKWHCL